jgi:hypothetical protein
MIEIKVKFKTIWGIDRFQPMNDSAKVIASLIGNKTLSREQLIICKNAGWKVKIPNMDVEKYLSDDYET